MAAEDKTVEEAAEEAASQAAEAEAEAVEAVEAEVIEDEAAESEPEAEEAPEEPAVDPLAAAKAETAEVRDRYARLQAEWDNYRKRTAQEREAEKVRAAEKLVKELLPVLDDMDRAIAHAKESGDGGSLTDGVEAINNKFLNILGKFSVAEIPAQGEAFDANKHQAVGVQEDTSVPEETVIQVYQKGYQMGERVLRPSMVITSTGGPTRTNEE